MADEAIYTARAKDRIREVLDEQHAVVLLELEARISEAGFSDSGINIDPHHITTALRELVASGDVIRTSETTRGGQAIETIQPADPRRRATAITAAARRKRLLYARYRGWALGTKRHPHGLVGPAGEEAVRTAILLSGGMQPVHPDAGPVNQLLNVTLAGPLDSAGYTVPIVNGVPGPPVTVLVEVKNIRGWMYPQSEEIYQLLHKGYLLQQANPTQPILPVFICRKAHPTTFWMAHQLGFMVIDMGVQFTGDVEQSAVDEVRVELYFHDLRAGNGPSLRVRDRFRNTVPIHCTNISAAWRRTALDPDLTGFFDELRRAKGGARSRLMNEFRQAATDAGHRGGW